MRIPGLAGEHRFSPQPGRRHPRRSPGRWATSLAATILLGLAAMPPAGVAAPVRDSLPFLIAFGRPRNPAADPVSLLFWSEGGRLHLRVVGDGRPHRIAGELRTSRGGVFQDVRPTSERARPRQPRPGKMFLDIDLEGAGEEGIDVIPSGDFAHVTFDLLIDGERRPEATYIGELGKHPIGLPVKIRIAGIRDTLFERLGF